MLTINTTPYITNLETGKQRLLVHIMDGDRRVTLDTAPQEPLDIKRLARDKLTSIIREMRIGEILDNKPVDELRLLMEVLRDSETIS